MPTGPVPTGAMPTGAVPTGASLHDRARALWNAALAEAPGARALVCYSSGRHFLTEADPVWWLTRLRPLGPAAAAVDDEGEVTLFVEPPQDLARAVEQVPCAEVRPGGSSELSEWARRHGARGGVALWGGHKLVARSAAALAGALGTPTVVDEACESVSRRRDPADLARLVHATRLAHDAEAAFRAAARPGVAEFEVAAAVRAQLRRSGAGDVFLLVSSSQHNLALHPPTDRVLAEGDLVLLELSPSVDGMFTQSCRTAVVGPAAGRLRDDYELLTASLVAGAAACCAGAAVADVVAVMDRVIGDGGYEEFCRPPHMRARGHGLGLASSLPGDLTRDSERRLVEGDVFVLHPNQYLPSSGYLLCGETLVVTAEGGRPLSGGFAPLAELGTGS